MLKLNTALLVGSGFSIELGIPLITKISKELKNFYSRERFSPVFEGWIKEGFKGISQDTMDDFYNILEDRVINYEEIIGSLEDLYNKSKTPKRNEYWGLLGRVNEYLSFIFVRYHLNLKQILDSITLYEGFKKLAENLKPIWIFTLNHDLVIEMIASEFKIPLSDGLGKNIRNIILDSTKIPLKFYPITDLNENKMALFENGDYGINLIKIHGSLGLYTCFDNKFISKLVLKKHSAKAWIGLLLKINYLLKPPDLPKAVNEIIYKDEKNQIQFLQRTLLSGTHKFENKNLHQTPFHFLQLFKRKIDHFRNLLIIGYGFKDFHINEVVEKWFREDKNRTVEIIDPFLDEIPKIFQNSKNRIQIKNKSTTEYLKSL